MPDPTLYLFDGHNLLHAGEFRDQQELVDRLASFVALRGAVGVVVFDGAGDDRAHGPLEVRYAPNADAVLERLAAERREQELVCLVSSDSAVRGTSGQEVRKLSSRVFLEQLEPAAQPDPRPERLEDRLDQATRERLERLRRGQGSG
ncbi:MAG: NYN domain-containing protein [Gaiellaceae bacterium]